MLLAVNPLLFPGSVVDANTVFIKALKTWSRASILTLSPFPSPPSVTPKHVLCLMACPMPWSCVSTQAVSAAWEAHLPSSDKGSPPHPSRFSSRVSHIGEAGLRLLSPHYCCGLPKTQSLFLPHCSAWTVLGALYKSWFISNNIIHHSKYIYKGKDWKK